MSVNFVADQKLSQDYYPFGMAMPGREFSSSGYRFGFNGQEKTDEISGNGNHSTAEFWEYDTRLGRRWNLDPKPDFSYSLYSCFKNNPIYNIDIKGDTSYRFNQEGKFQGMADLDRKGIMGTLGSFITEKNKDGNEIHTWKTERAFAFNDPQNDKFQLNDLNIGDQALQIISDPEVNDMMAKSDINERNIFARTYFAATENGGPNSTGNKLDFSMRYLKGSPGGGKNDNIGGFFLFGDKNFAYNSMDAGNWLYGQAMNRMGFGLALTREGAQYNEGWNDSNADQQAIRRGFQYKVNLKTISTFQLKNN